MEDKPWDRSDRLVALLLVFLALAAFAKTTGHLFLLADDPEYTFRNEHVKAGLTGSGVAWAFRSVYALNWHPVTWLSHMLDVQLFGMNPAAHHLVNLLLHIANTVLLFDLLRRATGAREASAFVAAVFAVHPLHVESVAWVAERKDLLCGLFWLLAMRAYVRYVRLPGAGRYAAVLAFFALGLLSKAMIVTLPFLLLLLDYWPLGRFAPGRPRLAPIVEKIPFLILAAGTGIVTYLAQDAGGAVNALPFGVRAANGLTAYAAYLGKFIWPHPLAIYYPHPSEIGKAVPAWKAAGAFLLLAGATGTALAARKRRPWLLFGWLWFLVGLSPVIGIVQAGGQSMADRYMYMPIIGLLVLVAWESADRFGTRPFGGGALRTAALFSIAALAFLTWRQTDHWHDTVAALTHATDVTSENRWAERHLGNTFEELGDFGRAARHYENAARILPDANVSIDMGRLSAKQGDAGGAARHFREALRFVPGDLEARLGLAAALDGEGKTEEAVRLFAEILRDYPDAAEAAYRKGNALLEAGKPLDALAAFRATVRLRPGHAEGHNNLGVLLGKMGKTDEAIVHFREALRLMPGHEQARRNLEAASGGR